MNKKFFVIMIFTILLMGCVQPNIQQDSEKYPPISPFPKKGKTEITLYFPDENLEFLVPEKRKMEKLEISKIVQELLNGTKRKDLKNIIPKDTQLLSTDIIGEVAYVNFSKELAKATIEKNESLIIYSIVNSVTQLEDVSKVQILIEGELKEVLYKHYSIDEPKSPSELIVNREYVSPMDTIIRYYENLKKKDYHRILKLIDIENREDINYLTVRSYYEKYYEDIANYEIKSYVINEYGENINVKIRIDIYYNNGMKKKEVTENLNLIFKDGNYKITDIL
ncbi:GerMN domain-containing protein [Thermohalobacter berrensis]|uniref:GerMN domain-containing protein n=1 Tax=Thermohalobacter berrensis TaxID=99594 RepID=A0A419T4U3_9FIRM|nr:GerMN domain-containing protein [Thermohalobacter berrensis]RKD32475.1 hypothetical protein BET03_11220 [Thermohalobacter berrensis]